MKPPILLLLGGVLQFALCCPQQTDYVPMDHEQDEHLKNRGFPIEDSIHGVWPEASITYCFDPANGGEAKQKLQSTVANAWNLWKNKGVGSQFKMKEGDKTYCDTANRGSYLLIKYNSDQVLDTTPGYTASLGERGPSMNLDPSDGFGSGKGVSNVAHEIGHAWGLYHEHQRPSLWNKAYGGTAQVGTFKFFCKNMKDYEVKAAENDMDGPCHFERAAARIQFSAHNLLPITDRGRDTGMPGGVDWKSIMIYGSTAGSKTENGQRLYTLTQADGTKFGYNLFPSEGDVESLYTLYSNEISVC